MVSDILQAWRLPLLGLYAGRSLHYSCHGFLVLPSQELRTEGSQSPKTILCSPGTLSLCLTHLHGMAMHNQMCTFRYPLLQHRRSRTWTRTH